MTAFNSTALKPASQIEEFADKVSGNRTAKQVILAGIARQKELFKDPKAEGRRWFTSGKTHTAFTLRVQNKALKLSGEETKLAVETKDFEAALSYFAKEIESGKFDQQLADADKAMTAKREKMVATRTANKGKPKAK